jgi:hypothetical protein
MEQENDRGFASFDARFQLARDFVERCWQARLHHQRTKTQIVLAASSVGSAVMATTGLVDAHGVPYLPLSLPLSLAFLCTLAVAYFYYQYHAFRIFSYDYHIRMGEENCARMLGEVDVPSIHGVLAHTNRCGSRSAKWLLRLAGAMLFVALSSIALVPVARMGFSNGSLVVAWQSAATFVFFLTIVIVGSSLCEAAKHRVRIAHRTADQRTTPELGGRDPMPNA